MTAVDRFGKLARTLGQNGFEPVPITPGTKAPRPKGWQHGNFASRAHEFENDFTGVRTRYTPGIDLDLSDPELVRQSVDIVCDVLGCREIDLPARVGMAPRTLLVCRTDQPFTKRSSAAYELPTDPIVNGKVKHSKAEILADGQQFVAYAIHPHTHRPYGWITVATPMNTHEWELVTITEAQADEIIRRCEALLAEHGKRQGGTSASSAAVDPPGEIDLQAREDAIRFDDTAANRERLKSALKALHPDADPSRDGTYRKVISALHSTGWSDWLELAQSWASGEMHGITAETHNEKKFKQDVRGWDNNKPKKITTIATIFALEKAAGGINPRSGKGSIALEDFHAHLPTHAYLFKLTREMWPAASVNAAAPWPMVGGKAVAPATWLDTHRAVVQLAWHPDESELIVGRVLQVSGWVQHPGAQVFNLYRPPVRPSGDAAQAGPWLDHVRKVYPDDAGHIITWLAHKVQKPGDKINHALVLGGLQGIGKDTLLEPVKAAVGPWNWQEISPSQMLGRFNGWAKAVIVRISEARDLGDVDRFAFYDHSKVIIAAPPDALRVDEKHLRETYVANVCGVVITTNHAADGLYLPADDRRHYVAWSPCKREDFSPNYWINLYRWFNEGGIGHVCAYLAVLDLSTFDPKAPPPKTAAFWNIVAAGEAPESGELRDILDSMGKPAATTLQRLIDSALELGLFDVASELRDRKTRRQIPHRLERVGYVPVRNPDSDDGLFKINDKRQAVYAQRGISLSEQVREARKLS